MSYTNSQAIHRQSIVRKAQTIVPIVPFHNGVFLPKFPEIYDDIHIQFSLYAT